MDLSCKNEVAKVSATAYAFMATQPSNKITCYKPGIYQSGSSPKNAKLDIATGDIGLLMPGTYYLKSGMQVRGRVIGGYEPASTGWLMLTSGTTSASSTATMRDHALDAGTKPTRPAGAP